MNEEDRQSQLLELEAFESVLREGKLEKLSDWNDENRNIEGSVEIDFDSLENRSVTVTGVGKNGEKFLNRLEMLPPVRLKFDLPCDYPSSSYPKLKVESDWMTNSQIELCEKQLEIICKENETMPVLYMCYEAVLEKINEMPRDIINLNEAAILKNNENETIENLRKRIIGESERATEENFANTLYECEICYDSFMGRDCIKFLPCQHIYCRICTFEYYRSLAQGLLSKPFQCLSDKCSSEAPQALVREALGEELFAKYEQCLLEVALQDIDGMIKCPRESCQKVAYITDVGKNLVECSYCNFSFCNLCKQTFHGVSPCKFKVEDKKEILDEWNAADDEEKLAMAKRFGGDKNMKDIIERFLNENWLELNSKCCPKCSVSIEKNDGCHKMHCTKCNTYFCWLCNSRLDKVDPYAHFRDDGKCAGRLFEGAEAHDDDFWRDAEQFFDEVEGNAFQHQLDIAFDEGSDYDEDEDEEFPYEFDEEDEFDYAAEIEAEIAAMRTPDESEDGDREGDSDAGGPDLKRDQRVEETKNCTKEGSIEKNNAEGIEEV